MVFWAIIYSIVTPLILLDPSVYAIFSNGYVAPETASHKFRAFGFISTATFACIFSWILNRLRSKQEMMDQLLLHMPLPVLVSDIEGVIILSNEKARSLLGISVTKRDKGMFFDLLAPNSIRGDAFPII